MASKVTRVKWSNLCLVLILFSVNVEAEDRLSLEEYRKKIQEKSLKIQSIKSEKEGSLLEFQQAQYLTTPQAFVDYQESKDKSPNLTPEFSGTERNGDELKVGVQTQTTFGLKPRIFGFTQNQKIMNVSSLPTPDLSLQRKGYGLEAEISLWKNAFGKDVRNNQESLKAISESKLHQAELNKIVFEVESDNLYFESAFLIEAIAIQEELVKQGEKLVNWTKDQSGNRLLEPVHVAQATAAHQSRKVALINYKNQLHSNLLKMSQLIGQNISRQTLLETPDKLSKSFRAPSVERGNKLTVKPLVKAYEAEQASLRIAQEGFKPDLSLRAQYLTFSDTGRQDDSSRCRNQSDCRTLAVSLNLTVPLDFSTWEAGSKSASAKALALDRDLNSEIQNSEVEKKQIEEQLAALKDQIIALEKLIQAQELRLKKERERQRKGRATTFDLITSEQELGESLISLSEAKTKYISTGSQYRLFEEAK